MPKRLIEDLLPLGELNNHAQKGGGVGSLNAMHPYFARRPLTASRAMTLAALVAAPANEEDRHTLERLLIDISSDEWPDKTHLIQQAQELIRQAHDGRVPRVLDPFAGGGSMPLEAMRLGCEATALDLNPVAYLALIASLVYPQKFGVLERPTDNGHQKVLGRELDLPKTTATPKSSQLVEDVRYWAGYVLDQARIQIGECYPTDADGATPVAYLWARTITCPHCCGEVPLIKRRWLQQSKNGEQVAYQLKVDKDAQTYCVEIVRGADADKAEPERGTIRGANVECIYCGVPTERARIVAQAKAGQMGQHMLVVVLFREGTRGRDFRPATTADRATFAQATELLEEVRQDMFDYWGEDRLLSVVPDEPTPHERARSISIRLYGITEWGHLFNDRQALALVTLGQQIRAVRELLTDTHGAEYARAVALYLSFIQAKLIGYNSTFAWWQPSGLKTAPAMSRHDIQMTWDYAESNPFSGQATSWKSFIEALWRSIENSATVSPVPATVRLGSAASLPPEWAGTFDAVICDPPYYDSVTYADLSDYFYPWHKRIVGDDYPEAFVTEVTPKEEELVQEAIYHGGTKASAKQFYEDGMSRAFAQMYRVLRDDGIAVIMFAHKKSSAWETLVNALIRAGFQVTASWPLNTEGRRLQSYRAVALASSVYLVCRKRARADREQGAAANGQVGYLEDIQAELRETIRRYLERFWGAGIGGADFFMSAIGPGLSVYSRYPRVERYDGSQVVVSDFLELVRHETATFAVERIIGEQSVCERLDQQTRFYLLWQWGYDSLDVPDGEALLLSTAVGIDLRELMERFSLVGKVKDKLRLLDASQRSRHLASVTQRVAAGGAVPLIDVLHKACLLWQENQQDELSALVAARGGELWPVAQALVELLPRNDTERKALMSMLGTRLNLESQAQRWAQENRLRRQPQVQQTTLWDDEEI